MFIKLDKLRIKMFSKKIINTEKSIKILRNNWLNHLKPQINNLKQDFLL